MAGGRDVDHLAAQRMDERVVLAFRVAYDHVVPGDKENIGDLPLCGEGFAGAGRTEDQAVRVFELLAVHHDHVVGKSIQPVIEGFALHEELLCRERDKDRGRSGRQGPFDRDQVQPEGNAAHQSLLLLIIQPAEYAVVFLCNAGGLEDSIVKLLACPCRVEEEDCDKEHPLIAGLQVLQQPLCFISVGHQV